MIRLANECQNINTNNIFFDKINNNNSINSIRDQGKILKKTFSALHLLPSILRKAFKHQHRWGHQNLTRRKKCNGSVQKGVILKTSLFSYNTRTIYFTQKKHVTFDDRTKITLGLVGNLNLLGSFRIALYSKCLEGYLSKWDGGVDHLPPTRTQCHLLLSGLVTRKDSGYLATLR